MKHCKDLGKEAGLRDADRSTGDVDQAGVVSGLQQGSQHMQQLRLCCKGCQDQHSLASHAPLMRHMHLLKPGQPLLSVEAQLLAL